MAALPVPPRLAAWDAAFDRCSQDPRPDCSTDHWAWRLLLTLAFLAEGTAPHAVFGALHALRCAGGHLAWDADKRRWRLLPPGAAADPALSRPAAWQAFRQRYLLPHAERLQQLLAVLPAPDQVWLPPLTDPPAAQGIAPASESDAGVTPDEQDNDGEWERFEP